MLPSLLLLRSWCIQQLGVGRVSACPLLRSGQQAYAAGDKDFLNKEKLGFTIIFMLSDVVLSRLLLECISGQVCSCEQAATIMCACCGPIAKHHGGEHAELPPASSPRPLTPPILE